MTILKKNLLHSAGLFLLCLSQLAFASHIEEEVRKINSNISFLSNTRYQETAKPRLFAKIIFPILLSKTEPNPAVDFFNQQVNALIENEVQTFKKSLPPTKGKAQNRFFVDYSSVILTIKNNPIISIRFVFQELPLDQQTKLSIKVINYDLATGQLIQFDDLFDDDTDLLNILSNQIQAQLIKRLGGENTIAPTLTQVAHFKQFSLHPQGIIFHFMPGEIAKPNFGSQSVLIPYAQIKDFLSEDSLIANCANHPKSCKRSAMIQGSFTEG